ncbi:MAG TPA: hypothetical protein DEF88_14740 [Porphyromonadaceae bacterium]|jgi:hypothetical protein|nr:hypothetical protein [Porphyromonadaceae bacterium]HBX21695.1 hypothetical protein [Porphyromonadaceae bacterium]HCM21206.1 hypothetical protein [Porphyromonadaceae bacterium]
MESRRKFIKHALISSVGLGIANTSIASSMPEKGPQTKITLPDVSKMISTPPDIPFVPKRVASWWVTIEDLQWPQKSIRDKIKRRAEAFAEAKIDMAVNYGFHIRFNYANYFGHIHGYMANVCEELHKYGIKYMDHYSCNHIHRPKNQEEFRKLHKSHRHHVLLFHDPVAADYAQYEGHLFNDLCEVDIRDGSRGYAAQYQMEAFCHNNPNFLDMHVKYLKRLLNDVPIDAIEVDDMCDYVGLAACGCPYCRERFKRDYGRDIPPFNDPDFWGDTSKPMLEWGNYENPVFREFIRMKIDGIVDHVKLVKSVVGNIPLMSCCSSTGPILLNSISLDLEKMAPYLDFFMLENVGTNVNSINWVSKDAEALHQKDIARQRGNSPAIALSYTIYEKGGYLGWALSRFWGVANWSSTHNQRLEEDPVDAREMEDVIHEWNNWEVTNSDLDYTKGNDWVEVRLVSNSYCRDNGWRDENGKEHWDRLKAWSRLLVKHNVGYRFLRTEELADGNALKKESTPLILDGVACVSDVQYNALCSYLASNGKAWLAYPFGTHDEKGFKRPVPLSNKLIKLFGKKITIIRSAIDSDPLSELMDKGEFSPVITQTGGDPRWAVRMRMNDGKFTMHFMNTAMKPVPHPTIKDNQGLAIIQDIDSFITNNRLSYEIKLKSLPSQQLRLMSPETNDKKQIINLKKNKSGAYRFDVDLSDIKIYALLQ